MEISNLSPNFWLALLAVIQFFGIAMHFFSPLIFVLLPFAITALIVLFIAIYYKWRRGIQIFMAVCGLLFILAFVPFLTLINEDKVLRMWHRSILYVCQMVASASCIALALYVMNNDSGHVPIVDNSKTEAQGGDGHITDSEGVLEKLKKMFIK